MLQKCVFLRLICCCFVRFFVGVSISILAKCIVSKNIARESQLAVREVAVSPDHSTPSAYLSMPIDPH